MFDTAAVTYDPIRVQAQHWTGASRRLANLEALAAESSWRSMEQYLQVALREKLQSSVNQLVQRGADMIAAMQANDYAPAGPDLRRQVEALRSQYLRVETMLDFFADALASRTNAETVTLLRACDRLAEASMNALLRPLGRPTPPVLVYIDKGLGAAILKAGLRLWDGHTENPVAAIKVVRHNLMRPTALIHEAGHQVAHITGWNEDLRANLRRDLSRYGDDIAGVWAGWASEIAADAFAFAHTGFASVAALHDVVDAPGAVFAYSPGDPHPVSFLRVLLGIESCRHYYGEGPWEGMCAGWLERYPLRFAPAELRELLDTSMVLLPDLVRTVFEKPCRAFGGRSLAACLDPGQSHPDRLAREAADQGKGFYASSVLVARAPLRRLAWNGYQMATQPEQAEQLLEKQRLWMGLLGQHQFN